ncbi:MAG: HAMP domain-containing sensor histidine kinase [Planctomycetota bacterium]|jgi:signal transduction histidine kinase|nr:HAMP domain-containing sensor histidine kinase [Planctomycetota bacterium]MDP6988081.1 HAMP domain-containing sensor histidine kinase [Planctomycetota bacterium]
MSWEWIGLASLAGGLAGWVARSRGRGPDTEVLARACEHLREGVILLDAAEHVVSMNEAARGMIGDVGELPADLERGLGGELAAAIRSVGDATARDSVEVSGTAGPRTLALTVGPTRRGWRFVVLEDLTGVAEVDRRRRDFVANASHELQTPIAALMGMLELMEEADGDYRRDLLRRSTKRAEALAVLTRDLIGLARAEDPDWQPPRVPMDLARVCEAVVERHADEARAKGLDLVLDVDGPTPLIGDATGVETCISNLVQNAISFTDEGCVEVRVHAAEEGGALIEVADTGSGIDPSVLPRIFERFFRGDPARSRAAGGSGLGLSIVRNLVGRMGGRIGVASRPGGGTRFSVHLPADPTRPLEGAGQELEG